MKNSQLKFKSPRVKKKPLQLELATGKIKPEYEN